MSGDSCCGDHQVVLRWWHMSRTRWISRWRCRGLSTVQRSRQGGGGNIGCPRASKALVTAGQRPAGLPAYPRHEAISHTGEIFLKHSRSKLIASATGMPHASPDEPDLAPACLHNADRYAL